MSSDGKIVGTANVRMLSANVNYVLDVSRPQPADQEITFRVGENPAAETATWLQGKITYPLNLNASSGGDAASPQVPPHAFSGLVTIDGRLASSGVKIAAFIEGRIAASAFTFSDGRYMLKVQQGEQNFTGKTVTFTVDGEMASQSALWKQGGVDLLDLSVYSGPRPITDVFASLISDGSLIVVWMYHNETSTWSVFDPRPEAAPVNDLIEVSSRDILWVEVSGERAFQGRTLYEGWNLIALR